MSNSFDERVAQMQSAKANRIIHTFKVPTKTAKQHADEEGNPLYTSIEVCELSGAEELRVGRETEADASSYSSAMTRACFVGINGLEEANSEKLFDTLPPKIRHLVTNAYSSVHFSDETEDFVKSGSVLRRVG